VRVTALDPTDPDPVEPAADDEGDQGSGLKPPQDASGPGDKAGNDTREKAAGDAGDKAVGGKAVGDAKSTGGAVDADADDMGAVKAMAKAEAVAAAKAAKKGWGWFGGKKAAAVVVERDLSGVPGASVTIEVSGIDTAEQAEAACAKILDEGRDGLCADLHVAGLIKVTTVTPVIPCAQRKLALLPREV
jgi:hypothetical protein